jgi:predicted acetyltransferase
MPVEYRLTTDDDVAQVAHVEAVAFYNQPTPERVDEHRRLNKPEWTVGAFDDGRCFATVRTTPTARWMEGRATPFGAVGPVACLAPYRRQGHVGELLKLALHYMRDRGQALSGLFTPHDTLYRRYGWERAEGRRRYLVPPKDVRLRFPVPPGKLTQVGADDWARLDAIYREWSAQRNGPLHRNEAWWREALLTHRTEAGRRPRDAVVWTSPGGRDEGFVVYHAQDLPSDAMWGSRQLIVRDFVALSAGAYLGLWQHLLAHDLAERIVVWASPEDRFPHVTDNPQRIEDVQWEGPMIRVVDVERAIALRPYTGERPVAFTARIADPSLPWNDGVWRIEAEAGRMHAGRTEGEPDVEMSVNALAPLYTGYTPAQGLAAFGFMKVNRPEALDAVAAAFAVSSPPYSTDFY